MIRIRLRFPRLCMGRGTARVRTRSPPQQQQYKRSYSSIRTDDLTTSEFSSKNSTEMNYDNNNVDEEKSSELLCGNRVMIVVDSSVEAQGALHWALSHTIQSQDTVILLHALVTNKSCKQGGNERAYELLSSMKNTCQVKRPGVQVETTIKEGKDKGATIVEEANKEKVSLLVLGQRKRSTMWRLRNFWAGKRKRRRGSPVDYCVQNAKCMTIAVRRKSSKHGGYLITTKRHKDFWLLA